MRPEPGGAATTARMISTVALSADLDLVGEREKEKANGLASLARRGQSQLVRLWALRTALHDARRASASRTPSGGSLSPRPRCFHHEPRLQGDRSTIRVRDSSDQYRVLPAQTFRRLGCAPQPGLERQYFRCGSPHGCFGRMPRVGPCRRLACSAANCRRCFQRPSSRGQHRSRDSTLNSQSPRA